MYQSSRRLAQVLSNSNQKLLRNAQASLLPPIPLYRYILRIHRRFPLEMRSLGDDYVKSEFRRHKTADNPVHIMGFLQGWKTYLDVLRTQADPNTFRGKAMDSTTFEKMSNEQLGQLYELMHASKDVWKPILTSTERETKEDS